MTQVRRKLTFEDYASLDAAQMAIYRASARKRHQQKLDRLYERHQLGLSVARQAAGLLKRDFQAEKVVLFGSMLSFHRIHQRSDVDLAVWGLQSQDYYRAVGCLLALEPDVSIDLVEAEAASPRILSEIETTGVVFVNQDAAILAVRIRAELIEIAQVVERAQRLLAKAIEQHDEDYYDGIALNLHSFYTAIERILEDIAREIDGAIPTGREWHRDLLVQMSAEVPAVRPIVIKRSSRHCLDEYRGVRHVIRNVYTFNLKPSRLQELVLALPDCYESLVEDLTTFCNFLAALGDLEQAKPIAVEDAIV